MKNVTHRNPIRTDKITNAQFFEAKKILQLFFKHNCLAKLPNTKLLNPLILKFMKSTDSESSAGSGFFGTLDEGIARPPPSCNGATKLKEI